MDASLIEAEANRERSVPGDPGLPPEASSRAIDEYLAVLDDATFGGATLVTPESIPPVDPPARWTAANKGPHLVVGGHEMWHFDIRLNGTSNPVSAVASGFVDNPFIVTAFMNVG